MKRRKGEKKRRMWKYEKKMKHARKEKIINTEPCPRKLVYTGRGGWQGGGGLPCPPLARMDEPLHVGDYPLWLLAETLKGAEPREPWNCTY